MEIDYQKIGFKSGLEIHQQLDTHKLFCNCPSVLRTDKPRFTVRRKLHAVAGESGKVDVAAKYEKAKNKEFIYEGYDTTCLVELDEEPPHEINEEALKITIQIALLLNCEIFPISQIMRKTVLDGSNTSGFQRTVLIGHDGYIETSFGRVSVDSVFLEEDAARPSGKQDVDEAGFENSKIYKLDRLGLPLVEIATGPHMKSPEQIKEVALYIGKVLRSCKVRRGIGTIRQDVNVSIKGSERVEIKGFQDPKMMIQTVDLEIERQHKCIKEKNCKKEVRKANVDGTTTFLRPMPGSARMYPETDLPLLKVSREMINDVKRDMPRLKDDIEEELKAKGLSQEMIKLVLGEEMLGEFEVLLKVYDNPNFVVKALILWPKELASREKLSKKQKNERLSVDITETILKKVADKKLSESDVKNVLIELAKGKSLDESLKSGEKKESVDVSVLEERVVKLIKEKPGLNANAYMGLLMGEFRSKFDGKVIMETIRKFVK